MLRNLGLERFQGYKLRQDAPLAPLTLIFGPNSSGKSSLVRSLLLLEQSAAAAEMRLSSVGDFTYAGRNIDLVGFLNVAYQHTDEPLSLSVRFDLERYGRQANRADENGWMGEVTWNVNSNGFTYIEMVASKMGFHQYANAEASQNLVRLKFVRDGDRMNLNESESSFEGLMHLFDEYMRENVPLNPLGSGVPEIGSKPLTIDNFRNLSFTIAGLTPLRVIPQPQNADLELETESPGIYLLTNCLRLLRLSLLRNLEGIRHVGPLRQVPQRLEMMGARKFRLASDSQNLNDFIGGSNGTRDFIANWTKRLTSGDYTVNQVDLHVGELAFLGNHTSLVLIDRHKKTQVSLLDAGVGISQVLPIIAQLAPTTGIRGSKNKTVIIEQPELHLHPRMQSDLADLMIEAINRQDRLQIIAETHSENLILRIQKRIREGTLSAEQVQVIYADRNGNAGNIITPLAIDEDGAFIDSWPASFVDARLDDLLDI